MLIIQYLDHVSGWSTLYTATSAVTVMELYAWMRRDDPELKLRTVRA